MTRLTDKHETSHRALRQGRPVPAQRGLAPSRQLPSGSPVPSSGPCPPLWERTAEWRELKEWILSREANRSNFYRDRRDLVTIGVGHLVDDGSPTRTTASRHRAGRSFATTHHALFTTRAGATVSPAQVYADWLAVLNRTRTSGLLRLRRGAGAQLFDQRLRRLTETMYRRFSFARCLPASIQMAILDARFNPGRHNPFRSSAVLPMWHALDRRRTIVHQRGAADDYDPQRALELFRTLWHLPGNAPYQNRHQWRIRQFEAGVAQMLAEDQGRFNSLMDRLAQ